jgi:hypothetical protein
MDNRHISLQKQLTEAQKYLLLLQERRAEYVDPTNIPLEQTRLERHWQKTISDLEIELAQPSEDDITPEPNDLSPTDTQPEFPIFGISFRQNPNFTGREGFFTEIDRNLNVEGTAVQIQAITGLGGVGKTQLAIEYSFRHANAFDLIWWITAETEETLTASYLDLIDRMNLPVKTGAEQ